MTKRTVLAAASSRRLRRAREHHKLSQRELAQRAGCAHTTIVRAENGHLPSAYTLVRVADVLDCSTDFLLGRA